MNIRYIWILSHGNFSMITLEGMLVFKRVSDFNELYINKNGMSKKIS